MRSRRCFPCEKTISCIRCHRHKYVKNWVVCGYIVLYQSTEVQQLQQKAMALLCDLWIGDCCDEPYFLYGYSANTLRTRRDNRICWPFVLSIGAFEKTFGYR